jgi:CRISPR-associated endonuclease Csn1
LWSADYGEIGDQRVVILRLTERIGRRAEAAQSFIDDFGVTVQQAAALRDLNFPTGWEPYSTRALQAFLPHLEAGVRFGALVNGPEWDVWRHETFPNRDRPTGEVLDKLPSPAVKGERERIARLRNPTVVRTRNELRKVVNNLIDMYGKPDLTRVEVARNVGRSKRDREELLKANRRQERRRKDAVKDLESKGMAEPARRDVEKWLLWKESRERCPYTGDQIGFDALFREGAYEVEHIWPRWRSFDDSFANKTLCRKDVNQEKRNNTPYEAFHREPDRWATMRNRVADMAATKGGIGMSRRKVKKFMAESMPDDFASRQLNDTGYAARQILGQLKCLWPDIGLEAPVMVQAVTGKVTWQLRKLWGLNNILSDDGEKTRADHRHHAIDALVVACTHPGMTNRLSRYWQAKDGPRAEKPSLPPPWPAVRADAERVVAAIVVSHRVRKKVSGPLHEEMPLGYTGQGIVRNGKTLGIYVKRMRVEKLSLATLKIDHVEKISRVAKFVVRDDALRKVLLAHVEAAGGKADKAYPPYPHVCPDGPEIRKVRVLATQQKELMVPASTGFADPANNHHIAIYRLPNGKVDFDPVSLFEASQRLSRREPVVRRDRGDGAEFVMSLAPGEAIEFPEGDGKGLRIVQGVWASGVIVTLSHTDADSSSVWRPSPGSIVAGGARKVSIDPIGRIRKAGD